MTQDTVIHNIECISKCNFFGIYYLYSGVPEEMAEVLELQADLFVPGVTMTLCSTIVLDGLSQGRFLLTLQAVSGPLKK